MANYSFDYGDVHFVCLDSNRYVDPNDADLQRWIAADLTNTDAIWKFVVFHHPSFNVGADHYEAQHMRVLAPLFESQGVDFVLAGHEHNYQRARPMKFLPDGRGKSADVPATDRRVPGTFTIDTTFDEVQYTRPNGVVYVVTGAGGKHLYDAGYTDNPRLWRHADDGNADYVAKVVTDRHSFTVLDVDGKQLTMAQVDETYGVWSHHGDKSVARGCAGPAPGRRNPPSDDRRRNPVRSRSVNAPSQITCGRPHSRPICMGVSFRPGISTCSI